MCLYYLTNIYIKIKIIMKNCPLSPQKTPKNKILFLTSYLYYYMYTHTHTYVYIQTHIFFVLTHGLHYNPTIPHLHLYSDLPGLQIVQIPKFWKDQIRVNEETSLKLTIIVTWSTTERRETRNFPYPSVFELTGHKGWPLKEEIRM